MKTFLLLILVCSFTTLTWAQQQATVPNTDDRVFIDFVGSGDIQKSVSEGSDINANTGLGIIYERYKGDDNVLQSFELEGVINIATTADTIKSIFSNDEFVNARSFGTYLLNPISAKQALYLNTNWYFGFPENDFPGFAKFANVISGVNVRVISSNNIWEYNNAIKHLGVFSGRIGVFHEFLPDNYRLTKEGRVKYSIFLGLNYTFRGLMGDISTDKHDELRKTILASDRTQFHGIEANFGFRLRNIRAEFQMPMLQEANQAIDGLTGTQFLFSIKFVGGFSLKVTDREDDDTDE